MSTLATLTTGKHTSAKAPVLTEGDISPAVMINFENTAFDFFISKLIPLEKQVTTVMPGIKDMRICDWILAECICLKELPFMEFMAEMRTNYLHQDWEDLIWNQFLMSMLFFFESIL